MRYLLVKEKNKKAYTLYCPDTYGAETWGSSSSQTGLKKKESLGISKLGVIAVNSWMTKQLKLN